MTPTWHLVHLVDSEYTTVAEIQFRDDQIDEIPKMIALDDIKYLLDESGGFYQRSDPS